MCFYAWYLEASVTKKWTTSTKYSNVILVTQWRVNLKEEQDIPNALPWWRVYFLDVQRIFFHVMKWFKINL